MIPKRLFLYILTLCSTLAYTQADWQWGISGGSFTAITNVEGTETIATDHEGNVFFAATVGQSNLALDGMPQDFYGLTSVNYTNILLGSYDCAGNYRWSRTIGGGSSGGISKLNFNDIKTDDTGNIYISGIFSRNNPTSPNVVFGGIGLGAVADTILPQSATATNTFKRGLFIAKYNNEGEMQWLKFPQAEDITFSENSATSAIALEVDPATGRSYFLTRLPQGVYGDGAFEATSEATLNYVLEYDTEGNFVSGTLMDFFINSSDYTFARNHNTGRFYLAGFDNDPGKFTINGSVLSEEFIASFDANGNYLWMELASDGSRVLITDLDFDTDNSVYIAGGAKNGNSFFGITFDINDGNYSPMVLKISEDGSLIWFTYPFESNNTPVSALAVSHGELTIFSFAAIINWQELIIPSDPNSGTDIYIAKLDKYTGTMFDSSVIESNFGNNEYTRYGVIANDPFGNYYIGGSFSQFMYIGDDTLLNGSGSFDFFLAKYGSDNCNCVLPTSSFDIDGAGTDYNFNFTGNTEGSTVTWDFGDDTSGDGFNPSHNYAVSGTYQVCATVTDACGSTQFCTTIEAVLSSNNPAFAEVSVYPNPATSQLNINTPEALQFEIYNVVGAKMQSGTLTSGFTTWNVQHFATGIYYLNLTKTNGATTTLKWVKTN